MLHANIPAQMDRCSTGRFLCQSGTRSRVEQMAGRHARTAQTAPFSVRDDALKVGPISRRSVTDDRPVQRWKDPRTRCWVLVGITVPTSRNEKMVKSKRSTYSTCDTSRPNSIGYSSEPTTTGIYILYDSRRSNARIVGAQVVRMSSGPSWLPLAVDGSRTTHLSVMLLLGRRSSNNLGSDSRSTVLRHPYRSVPSMHYLEGSLPFWALSERSGRGEPIAFVGSPGSRYHAAQLYRGPVVVRATTRLVRLGLLRVSTGPSSFANRMVRSGTASREPSQGGIRSDMFTAPPVRHLSLRVQPTNWRRTFLSGEKGGRWRSKK
ncbi:MAG: hypothetical protein M1823_005194 [Watsoniomyces obsoletus]|nr:MAG: hypothetical protein M1823_005194 [Watsoniomyces obsoletus]